MAKPVEWVGDALEKLKLFPEDVQDAVGYALHVAEKGGKHHNAKPLKGFKGSGVIEIVDDYDGDTYRAVYTVSFRTAIYVLHCFQKKSRRGIETPKEHLKIIEERYKLLLEYHKHN